MKKFVLLLSVVMMLIGLAGPAYAESTDESRPVVTNQARPQPTRPSERVAMHSVNSVEDRPSGLFSVRARLNTSTDEAVLESSDGLWQGEDLIALVAAGQWIQVDCRRASSSVGVHFLGDENDGWARVIVDDAEMWQGNTYGPVGVGFNQYLEITRLPVHAHRLRVEATGRAGFEGGTSHVTVASFSCGTVSDRHRILCQRCTVEVG